jgi:hypothetical protein
MLRIVPDVKLVYLVPDPIERFLSQYLLLELASWSV